MGQIRSSGTVRADDRQPHGKRLAQNHAQPLFARSMHEDVGLGVVLAQYRCGTNPRCSKRDHRMEGTIGDRAHVGQMHARNLPHRPFKHIAPSYLTTRSLQKLNEVCSRVARSRQPGEHSQVRTVRVYKQLLEAAGSRSKALGYMPRGHHYPVGKLIAGKFARCQVSTDRESPSTLARISAWERMWRLPRSIHSCAPYFLRATSAAFK